MTSPETRPLWTASKFEKCLEKAVAQIQQSHPNALQPATSPRTISYQQALDNAQLNTNAINASSYKTIKLTKSSSP